MLAVAHEAADLWRVRKLGGGSAVALPLVIDMRISSERAEARLVQSSFYKGSHVHAFRALPLRSLCRVGLMHYLVVSGPAHGSRGTLSILFFTCYCVVFYAHNERLVVTLLVSMSHHRAAHCNLKINAAFSYICYLPFVVCFRFLASSSIRHGTCVMFKQVDLHHFFKERWVQHKRWDEHGRE
jgi:hypothetical protein